MLKDFESARDGSTLGTERTVCLGHCGRVQVAGVNLCQKYNLITGLHWWLNGKESACNAGAARDVDLIPGLGRSPGGGHGNPLQYSCQKNSMDRGVWVAPVHQVERVEHD